MPEKKKTTVKKKTTAKKSTKKKAVKKTTKPAAKASGKTAEKKEPAVADAAKPARPEKAARKPAARGRLRVKQVRSTIHKPKTFKRTLVALGLKHHQDETVIADTPSARGMLDKVRHLVHVTPEES